LTRRDFNQFCFRNTDLRTVQNFFMHIMDSAAKFQYQQMNFIKLMMVTREMFPQLRTERTYLLESGFDYSMTALPHSLNEQQRKYSHVAALNSGSDRSMRRHSSKCREQCRALAKIFWAEDPKITITNMVKKDEISKKYKKLNSDSYKKKTIKTWIKDLCPNRKPGRRPKS
jgi:hypothetical protein